MEYKIQKYQNLLDSFIGTYFLFLRLNVRKTLFLFPEAKNHFYETPNFF